jgi:hypothetical protein
MKKKIIFWVMLVMVLAFGMTVVGCDDGSTDDDYDNRPRLDGFVFLDNYYPVVGETITATASFTKGDPIGTPSWTWYKTKKDIYDPTDVESETYLGSGTTYTVRQSDEGFTIWVILRYSGNNNFCQSSTLSTVIGIPATANVSISMSAVYAASSSYHSHRVTVTLTLSDGRWNDVPYSTASQWLTMSGIPSVSSWYSNSYTTPSVSTRGRELEFSYSTASDTTLSINSLTATLNTAQLSTMRGSTNVYNSLSAGTPTTVSVSQWTISQY